MFLQRVVDSFSIFVAKKTDSFVKTSWGKIVRLFVLVGPVAFIPTVYQAWTASNIDVFRTITWPLLILVNVSSFLNVAHNGDWRMRLVMLLWVVLSALLFLATLVR